MNTPTSDAIHVLIADDHRMVREGIRAFLSTQPDMVIVGEADSADAAVAACGRSRTDVALVDLIMPGGGIEATRRIRGEHPETQVVILTSYDDATKVRAALEAGAIGYVLKDVAAEELANAIRRAAWGESTLHPRAAAHLAQALRDPPLAAASVLSPRERDVVVLIAQGLANSDIATRLGIGEKTVKTHVSNVLSKLGVTDRTQAAVFAWRHGWVEGPKTP